MPDKIHNNRPEWRDRLEGLGEVPGMAPLNKTEAWEKLYSKLDQPENKNKKTWLWMAAAIMIGVLITITWFNQEKKSKDIPIVQGQKILQTLNTPQHIDTPDVHAKIAQPGKPGSLRQKEKANAANHLTSITNQPGPALHEKEISPVLSSVQPSQEPDLVFVTSIDSQIKSLVPLTTTKKKMSVVYLNEIEAGNNIPPGNQAIHKKHRPLYPKFGQTGGDDIYVSSQPERFTITISSTN